MVEPNQSILDCCCSCSSCRDIYLFWWLGGKTKGLLSMISKQKSGLFYMEKRGQNLISDQYGRNWDKRLKCTNIPSDIDSIHNRRPQPSFGDNWSSARGPRHPPPFQELWWLKMKDRFITSQLARLISPLVLQRNLKTT